MPGDLSPSVEEGLARLGAWLPFGPAAEALAFFWEARISTATARRHAEAAGAAYAAIQAAEVERLEREAPAPPSGPAVQQVSADGAMVPLVGGTWAEVKTVAIGVLAAARDPAGPARATELSYFSRRADWGTFTRLAHVELHRRGTATAGAVVGVMDGAEWLQKFLDYHRPDAVRVLDFPHALEHLAGAGQATFGAGTLAARSWLERQADALRRGAPRAALVAVATLPVEQATDSGAASRARDATFRYLEKRLDQLRYAEFLALGYRIGSGLVESANKLVVEARLKGSGMHWAPDNVDPMLALRNIACAGRAGQGRPSADRGGRRGPVDTPRQAGRRWPPHRPAPLATPVLARRANQGRLVMQNVEPHPMALPHVLSANRSHVHCRVHRTRRGRPSTDPTACRSWRWADPEHPPWRVSRSALKVSRRTRSGSLARSHLRRRQFG